MVDGTERKRFLGLYRAERWFGDEAPDEPINDDFELLSEDWRGAPPPLPRQAHDSERSAWDRRSPPSLRVATLSDSNCPPSSNFLMSA